MNRQDRNLAATYSADRADTPARPGTDELARLRQPQPDADRRDGQDHHSRRLWQLDRDPGHQAEVPAQRHDRAADRCGDRQGVADQARRHDGAPAARGEHRRAAVEVQRAHRILVPVERHALGAVRELPEGAEVAFLRRGRALRAGRRGDQRHVP